jgi:hypothetical protein
MAFIASTCWYNICSPGAVRLSRKDAEERAKKLKQIQELKKGPQLKPSPLLAPAPSAPPAPELEKEVLPSEESPADKAARFAAQGRWECICGAENYLDTPKCVACNTARPSEYNQFLEEKKGVGLPPKGAIKTTASKTGTMTEPIKMEGVLPMLETGKEAEAAGKDAELKKAEKKVASKAAEKANKAELNRLLALAKKVAPRKFGNVFKAEIDAATEALENITTKQLLTTSGLTEKEQQDDQKDIDRTNANIAILETARKAIDALANALRTFQLEWINNGLRGAARTQYTALFAQGTLAEPNGGLLGDAQTAAAAAYPMTRAYKDQFVAQFKNDKKLQQNITDYLAAVQAAKKAEETKAGEPVTEPSHVGSKAVSTPPQLPEETKEPTVAPRSNTPPPTFSEPTDVGPDRPASTPPFVDPFPLSSAQAGEEKGSAAAESPAIAQARADLKALLPDVADDIANLSQNSSATDIDSIITSIDDLKKPATEQQALEALSKITQKTLGQLQKQLQDLQAALK